MPDSSDPTSSAPKLHIDSDWKAQAQAEKERLSQREAERAHDREGRGEGEEFPPADFKALAGMLASQALMGLGAYGDEQGRMIVDLPGSRFAIDLLGVLEEKTKGNLTPDEAKELTTMLSQLRSRFMQLATAVAQHMQARGTGAAGGVAGRIDPAGGSPGGTILGGGGGSGGKKPSIEIP